MRSLLRDINEDSSVNLFSFSFTVGVHYIFFIKAEERITPCFFKQKKYKYKKLFTVEQEVEKLKKGFRKSSCKVIDG